MPQSTEGRADLAFLSFVVVVVFAIAYGKRTAIVVAVSAGAVLLVQRLQSGANGLDYYDLVYGHLWSPVLLAISALFVGEIRDRWQTFYDDALEAVAFRTHQRDVIAAHAEELRGHIGRLEFHVATQDTGSERRSMPMIVGDLSIGASLEAVLEEIDFPTLGLSRPIFLRWFEDRWTGDLSEETASRLQASHGAIFLEAERAICAVIRKPDKSLVGALIFDAFDERLRPASARRLAQVIADEIGQAVAEEAGTKPIREAAE
ncbi:MAG: hypothetical protein VYD57_11390 [Pseudomonadota bacterium]|nr:hypothetical protein [Pseudomonadota bacterium]